MSDKPTRRRVLAAAGGAVTVALAGCLDGADTGGSSDGGSTDTMDDESMGTDSMDDSSTEETDSMNSMSGPATVTVRIENVAPTDYYGDDTPTSGAIWITPGAYAIHSGENPIFTAGEEASIGLEALAEAGPPTGFEGQPGLVDELGGMTGDMGVAAAGAYTPENTVEDPSDPMGEVPGAPPIAPGGAFEFEVEAEPGQRLSFASMFVPSNDVFVAPDAEGIDLWPEDGEVVEGDVTDRVALWDAGTEPNAAPGQGPDQAPAQDSPDQGEDEGGVVRPLSEVDDGHDYPDVTNTVRVTLSPSMDSMDEDNG